LTRRGHWIRARTAEELVGAGVEHEVGAARLDRGFDVRHRLLERAVAVLDVGSHRPGVDGPAHGGRHVAVTRLQVRRHGNVHTGRYPADHVDHQIQRDPLAVRVSV
jgi:hypothetical protein